MLHKPPSPPSSMSATKKEWEHREPDTPLSTSETNVPDTGPTTMAKRELGPQLTVPHHPVDSVADCWKTLEIGAELRAKLKAQMRSEQRTRKTRTRSTAHSCALHPFENVPGHWQWFEKRIRQKAREQQNIDSTQSKSRLTASSQHPYNDTDDRTWLPLKATGPPAHEYIDVFGDDTDDDTSESSGGSRGSAASGGTSKASTSRPSNVGWGDEVAFERKTCLSGSPSKFALSLDPYKRNISCPNPYFASGTIASPFVTLTVSEPDITPANPTLIGAGEDANMAGSRTMRAVETTDENVMDESVNNDLGQFW